MVLKSVYLAHSKTFGLAQFPVSTSRRRVDNLSLEQIGMYQQKPSPNKFYTQQKGPINRAHFESFSLELNKRIR